MDIKIYQDLSVKNKRKISYKNEGHFEEFLLKTFLFPFLSSFENAIFKSTYVPLHTKGARLHRQCHPYLTSFLTVCNGDKFVARFVESRKCRK